MIWDQERGTGGTFLGRVVRKESCAFEKVLEKYGSGSCRCLEEHFRQREFQGPALRWEHMEWVEITARQGQTSLAWWALCWL